MSIKQRLWSFLRGLARIIGPTIGRDEIDDILSVSDADALRSDWRAVGGDLSWAVKHYNPDAPRPDSWGD